MSPSAQIEALPESVDTSELPSAAARRGFWHLGQCSLDYKRQFGELPSATLKRSRAARG